MPGAWQFIPIKGGWQPSSGWRVGPVLFAWYHGGSCGFSLFLCFDYCGFTEIWREDEVEPGDAVDAMLSDVKMWTRVRTVCGRAPHCGEGSEGPSQASRLTLVTRATNTLTWNVTHGGCPGWAACSCRAQAGHVTHAMEWPGPGTRSEHNEISHKLGHILILTSVSLASGFCTLPFGADVHCELVGRHWSRGVS